MKKKALFLDMDETLCATSHADNLTKIWLASHLNQRFTLSDAELLAERYFLGVYKKLNQELSHLIGFLDDEFRFRCELIKALFAEQSQLIEDQTAVLLQQIDNNRMDNFDFFPGVEDLLKEWRKQYTLVVITNGPTFSQHPKLAAVNLADKVDHIIVGGEEPEEKPAKSIFDKALKLANITASEAIHIGDSYVSDVMGAHDAKITSVWITGQRDKKLADFTLDSITQLPDILTLFSHIRE